MSFIRVTFSGQGDTAAVDVVAALLAAGFPVRGKAERFFVLHDNGHVSQWLHTVEAHRALQLPGSELLLWLVPEGAVAAVVVVDATRITCTLGLQGAPVEDQQVAARAINELLPRLVDVELLAELD